MEFTLSEDIERFRDRVRNFSLREFPVYSKRSDEMEEFPEELFRKAVASDILHPEDIWKFIIALEEMSSVNPNLGISMAVPFFGNEILRFYGTQKQISDLYEPVIHGKKKMGLALTEPGGGSDLANLKTTAVREGDHYVISGSKMFITNGDIADFLLVLARTENGVKPQQSHSLFVLNPHAAGVKISKIQGKLGVRGTDTTIISLDGVHVDSSDMIGKPGMGFYYVMNFFDVSRTYVAALSVGIAEGIIRRLMAFYSDPENKMEERHQFAIADLAARVESARMLTYEAVNSIHTGRTDPVLTSEAKAFASEVAVDSSRLGVLLTGTYGMESDMEQFFRDAKIMEIWEGSSEIERLVIYRFLRSKYGKKVSRAF
ncbi:acyl-CoA dehydrogenase family protein [Thermoplasma sp.]|uniref:acyl-CoA dehydrogenase family protein n=1 Tax=Thermoplasma sp. TaxID=1973142 RepID=UPI00260910C0|nr:acyl-CoA dehydrogenase family protein [Thermoplasma sp.]